MGNPLAYPFREFCRQAGISYAQGYVEINAGRLKAHKLGTKTMIRAEDARAWLDGLPAMTPRNIAA